jgi:hypothetical protein
MNVRPSTAILAGVAGANVCGQGTSAGTAATARSPPTPGCHR